MRWLQAEPGRCPWDLVGLVVADVAEWPATVSVKSPNSATEPSKKQWRKDPHRLL